MDEPRTAFDLSRLPIPTSGPPDTPSETALAMADSIDPVHYSSGVYESQLQPGDQHEIIWMEDLTIPQWFVLPGQSETREFTFRVARTTASSVELRVDAWFVTNLHHDGWRTCRTNVSLADERFLAALRDEQSVDPNICLWASLQPRNTVRSLLDDDPYVLIEYVFDREGYFGGLAAYFASGESVTASGLDEVEKITRIRPVAGAAVVAALPLADATLEGG
jgi:hypothetical protein